MLRQLAAGKSLALSQRLLTDIGAACRGTGASLPGSSTAWQALTWTAVPSGSLGAAHICSTTSLTAGQHEASGFLAAKRGATASATVSPPLPLGPVPSLPGSKIFVRSVTGVVPPGPPTPPRHSSSDGSGDAAPGGAGPNGDGGGGGSGGVPGVAAPFAKSEGDSEDKHEELREQLEDAHGPSASAPPSLQAMEGIRTGHTSPHASSNVAEARIILQHANVAHLREELRALSERQATIPYDQLLDLCLELGAAGSRDQAEALAAALAAAGVTLRFRSQVYLRPDEVAHGVLQALPDTLEDLQQREALLLEQLEPLQQHKSAIDRAAHRRSKAVMWAGFSLLVGQWSVFYWLTWYELSWDIMEPVAYFVSLGTAIGFYGYFLLTNEAFDYQPLQRRLFRRWQQARLDKSKFDRSTHDRLSADLARYRRYIEHFKRR